MTNELRCFICGAPAAGTGIQHYEATIRFEDGEEKVVDSRGPWESKMPSCSHQYEDLTTGAILEEWPDEWAQALHDALAPGWGKS